MKKFTFLVFTLLCVNLQAQINIGGAPVSFQYEGKSVLESPVFVQTPPE